MSIIDHNGELAFGTRHASKVCFGKLTVVDPEESYYALEIPIW